MFLQLQQTPGPQNPVFLPSDGCDWLLAKIWVHSADFQCHQLSSHYLRTHMLGEMCCVATLRQLPEIHPLHQVMLKIGAKVATVFAIFFGLIHLKTKQYTRLGLQTFPHENHCHCFVFNFFVWLVLWTVADATRPDVTTNQHTGQRLAAGYERCV